MAETMYMSYTYIRQRVNLARVVQKVRIQPCVVGEQSMNKSNISSFCPIRVAVRQLQTKSKSRFRPHLEKRNLSEGKLIMSQVQYVANLTTTYAEPPLIHIRNHYLYLYDATHTLNASAIVILNSLKQIGTYSTLITKERHLVIDLPHKSIQNSYHKSFRKAKSI